MWPDLGKYVWTVLGAYGAGLGLVLGIIGLTLWQGRRTARALRAAEARHSAGGRA